MIPFRFKDRPNVAFAGPVGNSLFKLPATPEGQRRRPGASAACSALLVATLGHFAGCLAPVPIIHPLSPAGFHPMAIIPPLADIGMMKNKTLILTFLSMAALAVGCKQSDQAATSQQLDKVQTETTQAAQNLKDYTYAEKAEFVKALQTQLDTINQELDTLSAKVDASSDAVKADAKPKLQALRDQSAQLKQQLADVQNATESTWDSVKAATKSAYDSTAKGVVDARQWLSDKIAP